MRELPEATGKRYLSDAGVPTPDGRLVTRREDGIADVEYPDGPSVVKAQVPVSGRGRKGGVAFTDTRDETRELAERLLGSSIEGHAVDTVLVEELVDADAELYFALAADGSGEVPHLVVSVDGGRDVEGVPDDRVATQPVNPLVGARPHHLRNALAALDPPRDVDLPVREFQSVFRAAWEVFEANDLRLLEINPLVVTGDGELVALDAKLVVDEAALGRQRFDRTQTTLTDLEREASEDGVELRLGSGSVGVVSNGAGMGMSTLDYVAETTDASFAGFIDTHGAQFEREDVPEFLRYLRRAGSEVVLVNVIGPFLDCEMIAAEVVDAVEGGYDVPVVTRFKGLNAEEARAVCADAGLPAETEVVDAVERATDLLGEVAA